MLNFNRITDEIVRNSGTQSGFFKPYARISDPVYLGLGLVGVPIALLLVSGACLLLSAVSLLITSVLILSLPITTTIGIIAGAVAGHYLYSSAKRNAQKYGYKLPEIDTKNKFSSLSVFAATGLVLVAIAALLAVVTFLGSIFMAAVSVAAGGYLTAKAVTRTGATLVGKNNFGSEPILGCAV